MKIIVYNIFGLGHINPTLPLVKSLVDRGDDVIYHSSPERRELIESTGAHFKNYGRDDYKAADYHPGTNFVLQTLPATLGLLPFLRAEIESERPDLILYDSMAPWGLLLAHIYGIPSICLVTTMALSKVEKQKMLNTHGVVVDEMNLKVLKTIEDEFGLKLDFDVVLGAYHDCNIVFGLRTFNPPLRELKEENFHFLGSPSRSEVLSNFPDFLFEKKKHKVITMALGTLLPNEDPTVLEWFHLLLQAFSSDERFRIIIATGNEEIKKSLGPLAPNVRAFTKIPQLEILKHTDVFINHGGMNSISEGMKNGVPMLIIPHSKDQFSNSMRVRELGVGDEILSSHLTKENLRHKVLNLMFSPQVQKTVKKMKDEFDRVDSNPLSIISRRLA
jgi:MGT family glycosyltransferase